MKSVIVELRNGYASVLSDDGCIVKIKDNNYEIGQVIQMINQRKGTVKKLATFAASAAAILVLGVSTWAYASPYSYVSLDVNPSIQFVLNRFDRVLSIKSVNDDGEEVLQEIKLENLKNKTIVQAINQTLDQISQLGYLSDNASAGIVITTSGKNMDKADELAIEIKDEVEDELNETYSTASVEVFSVGLERVEAARELGVTPGKLNLVEKLIAISNDVESANLQEWLDKPVKDIMKATKAYRKAIAVTGSAITIEGIDGDDLLSDKEAKKATKEADKAAKEADKSAKKADKAADKAVKEADKVARDAAKAIDKAGRNVDKIAEKENNNKSTNAAETEAKKAAKEAEKAIKEAAKETEMAARKSANEAQKAAKDAGKAAKDANLAAKKAKKAEKQNDDKSTKAAETEAKKAAEKAEKAANEALKALQDTKVNDIISIPNDKSDRSNGQANDNKNNNSNNNNGNNSGNGKGPKK
jgi:hypothetical protein